MTSLSIRIIQKQALHPIAANVTLCGVIPGKNSAIMMPGSRYIPETTMEYGAIAAIVTQILQIMANSVVSTAILMVGMRGFRVIVTIAWLAMAVIQPVRLQEVSIITIQDFPLPERTPTPNARSVTLTGIPRYHPLVMHVIRMITTHQ